MILLDPVIDHWVRPWTRNSRSFHARAQEALATGRAVCLAAAIFPVRVAIGRW